MNNFDEIQSFKIQRLSSFSLPLICNLKNLENDIRFRTRGWKRRKTVGGNVSGIKYADGTTKRGRISDRFSKRRRAVNFSISKKGANYRRASQTSFPFYSNSIGQDHWFREEISI